MIRRNNATGELAYYRCWSPTPVPLRELVCVAGRAGRSRNPSTRARPSPGSTSTKSAAGTAGTAGPSSRCSPTPSLPSSPRPNQPPPAPTGHPDQRSRNTAAVLDGLPKQMVAAVPAASTRAATVARHGGCPSPQTWRVILAEEDHGAGRRISAGPYPVLPARIGGRVTRMTTLTSRTQAGKRS